jgi:DNA-binding CsgD family transcriptional regulator
VKRDHLGIVVYIANSLIMLSLFLLFVAGNSPAHYLISCVLIGVALGINDVFCFDTLFDVSCRMCNSQIIIGLGFGVRVLFIFLGIVIAGQYQETEIIQSNLLIILFSIIATMVLPFLRVAISRISPDSVFRINPIELKHNDTFVGLNTSPEVSLHIDQSLPVSDFSYLSCLSKRENEVLSLVLKGYPNDLISSSLFISNNTLKKHLQSIYSKLGVHSRVELFKLLLDSQH